MGAPAPAKGSVASALGVEVPPTSPLGVKSAWMAAEVQKGLEAFETKKEAAKVRMGLKSVPWVPVAIGGVVILAGAAILARRRRRAAPSGRKLRARVTGTIKFKGA